MVTFFFVLAAIAGYLLGSIPFGLVLTRAAGLGDIRQIGSGNIGATNVLRTGRKDIALATLVLDAAKAGLALLIVKWIAGALGGNTLGDNTAYQLGLVAGGAAFIGHCYPVWLGFKGGKGVATFFGVLFAGPWPLGLIAGVTWLAVATMFRFSSLAALCAAAIAPIMAFVAGFGWEEIAFTAVLAVLIFWRHRSNIQRLLAGTEPRIGDKKKDEGEATAAPAPASAPAVVPVPTPAPPRTAAPEPEPPAPEPTPPAVSAPEPEPPKAVHVAPEPPPIEPTPEPEPEPEPEPQMSVREPEPPAVQPTPEPEPEPPPTAEAVQVEPQQAPEPTPEEVQPEDEPDSSEPKREA